MTTRTKLIAANWKMNGDAQLVSDMSAALAKVSLTSSVDVLVCPPNILLGAFANESGADSVSALNFSLGGQNVSQYEKGAYTGETSVSQFESMGCQYVLLGHSERRELYGESDQVVSEKFLAIAASKLSVVLCIGETLEEREQGRTEAVIKQQLDAVLQASTAADWQNAVIAYEPVWAIGTGKTASPEQAQAVHKFIREYLAAQTQTADSAASMQILYGGSMKPENASDLLSQEDIDGGLIGGASLKPDSFTAIINAALAV